MLLHVRIYRCCDKGVTVQKQNFNYEGYAVQEKEVSNGGHSGRVFVPIAWKGKRVAIILLDDVEEREH